MTKISIITTLSHNVGDDFVRDGILYLLDQVMSVAELQLIHKHLPIVARRGFAWVHDSGFDSLLDRIGADMALKVTRRIDNHLPLSVGSDRVASADLLIQSGGPIYWVAEDGDCATTEWWNPLIERRWIPHARCRTFLNLAGGTCQRYDSDGSEFLKRPDVLEHIRRFYDLTALTTVRDELSVEVLRLAGRPGLLLPCTSIFAVDRLGIKPSPGEFVVLNYMPTGGHFLLGQKIDGALWERRFIALARRLATKHRVILVCHNRKESDAARLLLPDMESFSSPDYRAYLKLYSKAKWGIMNRVHGAFALASLGKPAAVIGSDSRAQMAGMLGLPKTFVNDATEIWLEGVESGLDSMVATFPATMRNRKAIAAAAYVSQLNTALRAKTEMTTLV